MYSALAEKHVFYLLSNYTNVFHSLNKNNRLLTIVPNKSVSPKWLSKLYVFEKWPWRLSFILKDPLKIERFAKFNDFSLRNKCVVESVQILSLPARPLRSHHFLSVEIQMKMLRSDFSLIEALNHQIYRKIEYIWTMSHF